LRWPNRSVLGAGVTSALGDFCYETTNAILPGVFAALGVPAALGGVEGVADATASFTKTGKPSRYGNDTRPRFRGTWSCFENDENTQSDTRRGPGLLLAWSL